MWDSRPRKELEDAAIANDLVRVGGKGHVIVAQRQVFGCNLVGPFDGSDVGQVVAEELLSALLCSATAIDARERVYLASKEPIGHQ